MQMKHTIYVTILAMVFSLTVCTFTGCGTNDATTNSAGSEVKFDISAAKALGITNSPITAEQARQIAEKTTGGRGLKVEQGHESGVEVFVVDVQVNSSMNDINVRVSDGAVMKVEADDDDEDDEANVIPDDSIAKSLGITNSPITHEQAIQIAMNAVQGTVLEVEEDNEFGARVIDVELQSKSGIQEVTMRASDGAVMNIQNENGGHEDDD
jgi:uncharacterized membrane protein YkoI